MYIYIISVLNLLAQNQAIITVCGTSQTVIDI